MKKLLIRFAAILVGFVGTVAIAYAVVTEFDDIALDGGGPNPFIRFDDTGPQKFIVGFSDHLAFWAGSGYSLKLYSTASSNSIIARDGFVGIKNVNPTTELDVTGNVLISGNLELGSSRDIKNNIKPLDRDAAMLALRELDPVTFNYQHSPNEKSVGFIAEDVPTLVASQTRKSINPMDVVAVLTKIVQEQQKTIDDLQQRVSELCSEKSC